MSKEKTNSTDLIVRLGALKPLVEQVAMSYGISQAGYIRFLVRRDLIRIGLLKGVASLLNQPTPIKEKGE